ncbi:hypothetical protein E4U59_000476 [Claviceps monticola]|nr:hypothetical protein E4U59_000476 [Claviceps monticola]
MAAFHNDWEFSFRECEEIFYYGWEKRDDEELNEEASTQFASLSMPWADIDFILNTQQAWADKHARGRSLGHADAGGDIYSPEEDTTYTPSFHQHVLQHSLGDLTIDARACFEADYDRALLLPFSPYTFSAVTLSGWAELAPPVVPVSLIIGPWDEEKRRRLFWLARGNLDYVSDPFYLGSRAVEVKLACIDAAAISAENLDPLIANCLMGSWLLHDLPQDARHERLVKLCNRIDRGGEVVDIEILRFVVRQLDHDREFNQYLSQGI